MIILVLALFLIAIAPGKRRAVPARRIYAHRGLHYGDIPENSLAAFRAAKEAGVGVELDVQLTRDKQPVVFHDKNLLRMCGKDVVLGTLTYDELCAFRLKNSDEKIPLLKEVIEVLGDIPMLLEIKNHGGNFNTEVCSIAAEELKNYHGPLMVESFSPFLVRWFLKNMPHVARGQLSANFMSSNDPDGPSFPINFIMSNLMLNFVSKPDFIAYRFTDSSMGFGLVRALWSPLTAGWTARGPAEIEKCRSSYDIVIFEKEAQK